MSKKFHLSYPFVVFDAMRDVYLMLPETSDTKTVQIYSTTRADFPWGWKLAAEKAQFRGRQLVDISFVRHRGRWWIWCMDLHKKLRQLRLFSATDLIDDDWEEVRRPPFWREGVGADCPGALGVAAAAPAIERSTLSPTLSATRPAVAS